MKTLKSKLKFCSVLIIKKDILMKFYAKYNSITGRNQHPANPELDASYFGFNYILCSKPNCSTLPAVFVTLSQFNQDKSRSVENVLKVVSL